MSNHFFKKLTATVTLVVMLLVFAGCDSGAKIPDKYNYDDLTQYVKIGEYKGLKYKKASTEVTDAEVQAKIDSALEAAATTEEITEGVATDTSIVNIDYSGSIDGEKFEGGTSEGYDLDLGNSNFIAGFAEAIVGHKVGETFDINVTFPEEYGNEELNGKDAVFEITINSMKETVVPEFNDEFVKANSDFSTTKEYKADVRKSLEAEKETSAENTVKQELFTKIVDDSNIIEYPEKELNAAKEDMIETYKSAASSNGVSYEDYIKNQLGMTTEEFESQTVVASAQNMVKQEIVIRILANELGLKFTDRDYDDFLMELLDSVGLSKDEFKTNYGITIYEYAEQQNLYGSMLYEKVMDEIIKISVAK